jgi:hypothetical protein
VPDVERSRHDRRVGAVRAGLSPVAFAAAWGTGERRRLDPILAEARELVARATA